MKRIFFSVFLFLAFATLSSFDVQQGRISRRNECDRVYPASLNNTIQWAKTYACNYDKNGYSWAPEGVYYSIQETNDGGYILANGITPEARRGEADTWVLKLDPYGDIEWQRAYGGELEDSWSSIQQASDGGYIVLSNTCYPYGHEIQDCDIWIFKLTPNGDVEWQRTFGGSSWEYAYSLKSTDDGGCVVTGNTSSFGADGTWILKLNSTGDIDWQRFYAETWDRGIQVTRDGGYILGSSIESFDENTDVWVSKLNSYGDIEWQRAYGGNEWDGVMFGIQQTYDGGYIVNCLTWSFGAGGSDIWILKLDSVGDIEWQRTYGGSGRECSRSIQQTSDGGYIIGGETDSFGAGEDDMWIFKLDSSGDIEWQRTYGGSEEEWTYSSIQQTSDGGYIFGGFSESFVGGYGLLILKLSPDGYIGPSCGIIGISDATVSDTNVTPLDTNVIPVNTNAIPQNTNVVPQNIDATSKLLCWNLNQPPLNVTLKREINRSLFRKEAFHTISWEPDPYNQQFSITEYRIYRKLPGATDADYQLIGIVSNNIFEYIDGYLDPNKGFDYAISSVDSEGYESPKSLPVRNPFSLI